MEIHFKLISRLLIKLFNKEMQRQFASEKLFADEIYKTYQNAVDEYISLYKRQDTIVGKHLFYENKVFEDEILKLKFISDYSFDDVISVLRNESNVIPPTEKDIKNFKLIFDYHIQKNEKLRDLEIEATYKAEIFEISSKIDGIDKKLEQLLSPDLQKEWEREISGYFETLKGFKPHTALNLLENFLSKKDKNKPDNDLLAFIHYQKGICYSFLDKKDEKFKSFITSYTLNPYPKEYKEQAILAYYDSGDLQSLQPILESLQSEDPFNSIAWAICYFKTDISNFQELISNTPSIILKDTLFQQLIFNHYYRLDASLIIKYEKDFFPILEDIKNVVEVSNISIETIHQSIFLANWLLTLFIRSYNYMGFQSSLDQKSIEILKTANVLLEKIIKTTKGTEVNYPIFLSLFSFTKYGMTKDKTNLLDAIQNIKEIPIEGNSFYLFICANYLQIEDYNTQSLDIIDKLLNVNQQDTERFITFALQAFIYLKQEKFEQAAEISIKSFNSIENIEDIFTLGYLHVIISIYLLKKLDNSLINRLKELKYQSLETKKLIIEYANCLVSNSTIAKEKDIESWLIQHKDNYQVMLYIANLYFFTKQYDKAKNVYSQVQEDTIKKHPRELSYYIQSLFSSTQETNTSLLLILCEFYRNNYAIDEHLLRIEYSIRQKYLDWEKSFEVCKIGHQQFSSDEYWLVQIIWCLDKLGNNKTELQYYLDKYLEIEKADISQIPYIINVLTYEYCIDKAVELAYKYDDPNIRMILLNLNLRYNQKSKIKDKFQELKTVEEGAYVSYKIDREKEKTILIDTKSQNKGEKEFSELLLNHNLNDIIPYESKYGNLTKSVKITRIEDKYVRAIRSIYKDAETPASGLPLEMFKFDKKDPIGSIARIAGVDIEEKRKHESELLQKYYNFEISILQFSITDYFQQIYLLGIKIFAKTIGIHTISIKYTKENIKKSSSYVLDFSSLFALYSITSKHELKLPTLYLSKYIVEIIETWIRHIKRDSDIFSTLFHNQPSYLRTEEVNRDDFVSWLTDILEWINKNCTVILPSKAVDFLHITYLPQRKVETDISFMLNYLLPTLSIIDETDAILITDDPISYLSLRRPILNETFSSEFFVKEILKENDGINSFFIENRYIDYTFTCKELISLYNAKNDSQECLDRYNFVIDKIQLWNIDVCFDFILYILNTTNNQNDIDKIIASLYKNRTKDDPINIMNAFRERSIILNDETLLRLFSILYKTANNEID